MKTRIRLSMLAILVTLAALPAGCASMDDRTTLVPRHDGPRVDADYVAAVETMAAQHGIRVEWVNPPTVEGTDE